MCPATAADVVQSEKRLVGVRALWARTAMPIRIEHRCAKVRATAFLIDFPLRLASWNLLAKIVSDIAGTTEAAAFMRPVRVTLRHRDTAGAMECVIARPTKTSRPVSLVRMALRSTCRAVLSRKTLSYSLPTFLLSRRTLDSPFGVLIVLLVTQSIVAGTAETLREVLDILVTICKSHAAIVLQITPVAQITYDQTPTVPFDNEIVKSGTRLPLAARVNL